jgi:flagellar hook-basal body complex protein FliE
MSVPAIPGLSVSAASAAGAYGRVNAGQAASMEGFGTALTQALQGVVDAGHTADTKSAEAIAGTGTANLTEVVTAVNRAELALQTTSAIRDRVVQAYQDIMKMPI